VNVFFLYQLITRVVLDKGLLNGLLLLYLNNRRMRQLVIWWCSMDQSVGVLYRNICRVVLGSSAV